MSKDFDGEFFPPIGIDWWRYYLSKGCSDSKHHKHHKSFISNLGYSLQYLEFLDYQCREEPLHMTVHTLTVKTFVVTTMSVIEGLAFYLLTINGRGTMKEWEEVDTWISNSKKKDNVEIRVQSTLQRKLEKPLPDTMTLDVMIKKLEKSNLLSISRDDYKTLSYFRKLRNKVHVYDVSHYLDTDWNSFPISKLGECKKVLGSFLRSEIFNPSEDDLSKLKWMG